MSLLQFPNTRKIYPGLENPVWVADILAANQLTLDGLTTLLNLPNPGFAIIAGMSYTTGSPNMYAPGIFWLNGTFYFMSISFSDSQYLIGALIDTLPEVFQVDQVERNIYTIQQAQTTASPTGATPLFSGNMNAYRIGINDLKIAITALQNTVNQLKGAAFLDIGTTAGTVAAGNDSRFGFTQAAADARYAQIANVLIEGSTNNNFSPTQPYDPATKKYVDTNSSQLLAKGTFSIGDGWNGTGPGVTVPLGTTLTSNSYRVEIEMISNSSNPANDVVYQWFTRNKQTTSFDIYFRKSGSATANLSINWSVYAL